MKLDMDAYSFIQLLRDHKDKSPSVWYYQYVRRQYDREVIDDPCREIKEGLRLLQRDIEMTFRKFWTQCSSVITMVWVADTLGVDHQIINEAIDVSAGDWVIRKNKHHEAKVFRQIVTPNVVMAACVERVFA